MIIDDGKGNGRSAGVDSDNLLLSRASAITREAYKAIEAALAFHVLGEHTVGGAATIPVLFLQNDDPERDLVIEALFLSWVAVAGAPAATEYWEVGYGNAYSAAGTALTPRNSNIGHSKAAVATAYGNNPTLTGTFVGLDKFYIPADEGYVEFEKKGSIVIPSGQALTAQFTTAGAVGSLVARARFYYDVKAA